MEPEFIRELFAAFGAVQIRRMFGGAGLWADGVMFALISRDVIYLKADEESIPAFAVEGCAAFGYETKNGRHVLTSYWRLPEWLYDDPDELAIWARRALAVARTKAAAKAKRPARVSRRKPVKSKKKKL